MNIETLMHMLAETLAEAEHELLGDTSWYVQADTHKNTPIHNLVEAKVQTLGDSLSDVKFKAMGMLHSR